MHAGRAIIPRMQSGQPSDAPHPPLAWPGIAPGRALVLPLDPAWLATPWGATFALDGLVLARKREFHVTVLDRHQVDAVLAAPTVADTLQALFARECWRPRRTGRYALLHRGPRTGGGEAWSVIEQLQLPAMLAFRDALADALGPAFADPVPHVTHFVHGDARGIGVPDTRALTERRVRELEPPG